MKKSKRKGEGNVSRVCWDMIEKELDVITRNESEEKTAATGRGEAQGEEGGGSILGGKKRKKKNM